MLKSLCITRRHLFHEDILNTDMIDGQTSE